MYIVYMYIHTDTFDTVSMTMFYLHAGNLTNQ